jgi:hypothetical protein
VATKHAHAIHPGIYLNASRHPNSSNAINRPPLSLTCCFTGTLALLSRAASHLTAAWQQGHDAAGCYLPPLSFGIIDAWARAGRLLFAATRKQGSGQGDWDQLPELAPGVFAVAQLLESYLDQPVRVGAPGTDEMFLDSVTRQLQLLAEGAEAARSGLAQPCASSQPEQHQQQEQEEEVQVPQQGDQGPLQKEDGLAAAAKRQPWVDAYIPAAFKPQVRPCIISQLPGKKIDQMPSLACVNASLACLVQCKLHSQCMHIPMACDPPSTCCTSHGTYCDSCTEIARDACTAYCKKQCTAACG